MAESNNLAVLENSNSSNEGDTEDRCCWVCFSTEEDDRSATWVHPCTCRGSTKWVHQLCLQRWVDEKQNGNLMGKVFCPQCNTEYIIVFPAINQGIFLLGVIDNTVKTMNPIIAAGIIMGAVYWVAVTFGAITVLQVLGNKDSLTSMEQSDPLLIGLPAIPIVLKVIGNRESLTATEQADLSISLHTLLISLPAIPLVLILCKMICWEDSVLMFLRRYCTKFSLLKYIMPSFAVNYENSLRSGYDDNTQIHTFSVTGIFCSALLFPTIATVCGNICFVAVSSNLYRTILGGLTFVLLKGWMNIYYKQQLYIRHNNKKILDYELPPPSESQPSQIPM